MTFAPLDERKLFLDVLQSTVCARTHRGVLDALSTAIRAAKERGAGRPSLDDVRWAHALDEECDLVENLLGAAFIVCQTQIAAVTSDARALCGLMTRRHGSFFAVGGGASELRARGPLTSEGVSKVDLLWALANYFKHRSEWSTADWTRLQGNALATARVIERAGLSPGSSGNLRTGAEALGNPTYENLDAFAAAIDTWAGEILDGCREEVCKARDQR